MRDYWWEAMEKRQHNLTSASNLDDFAAIQIENNFEESLRSRKVLMYHLVLQEDSFEISADHLYKCVLYAQREFPGYKRGLYIDIEGHRNAESGFDHDMFELQRHFLLAFLLPFLSELYIPLFEVKNRRLQSNTLPEVLKVSSKLSQETLIQNTDKGISGIWIADRDKWLEIE